MVIASLVQGKVFSTGGRQKKRREDNAHSVKTNLVSGVSHARTILCHRRRTTQGYVVRCILRQSLSFLEPLIASTINDRPTRVLQISTRSAGLVVE